MSGINWAARGLKSKALQNLLKDHDIKTQKQHRALEDAKATMELLFIKDSYGDTFLYELINSPTHAYRKNNMRKVLSTSILLLSPPSANKKARFFTGGVTANINLLI
jgi:Exonuclease.